MKKLEGKNIENKNNIETKEIENEIDFLKMDVEIMGNWWWNRWIWKKFFWFNEWFEKQDNPYLNKYIIIDGKRYYRNRGLVKSFTWLWYRAWYNDNKETAWYLYVWWFKNNKFSGKWVCYWNNGNKYEWNRENHKPTKWKAKYNWKEYDVVYDELSKWLEITSEGEYKGKHIKLSSWEFID